MTRTKALLGLAAAGVVLSATVAPAAVSALSGTTSAAQVATTTSQPSRTCQYPPSRQPALTLAVSPTTVKKNTSVKFTGKLRGNDCAISGATIGLYSSPTPNGPWTLIATVKTGHNGTYALNKKVRTTAYYKTVFGGDANYDGTQSNVVKVTVR